MTEMFGEAWSPMSVPDLAPDDDDDFGILFPIKVCNESIVTLINVCGLETFDQFFVINCVKCFGIIYKTGINVFLCFDVFFHNHF